ncbi:PAS domain S-box protein [Sesbania bispinosa]|nr:PAS domain S-box protein [Sesbania bispinosa]
MYQSFELRLERGGCRVQSGPEVSKGDDLILLGTTRGAMGNHQSRSTQCFA